VSTLSRGSDYKRRGEGERVRVRPQKKRLGKDSWMRGKDRQEERDESKSQLMLFQLLPRRKERKKPKQMRQVNKKGATE